MNGQLEPEASKSRASVILCLNKFVDQDVLGYREVTGKGGHHKVYFPLMDENGFVRFLLETMLKSAMRDFPKETRKILDEYFLIERKLRAQLFEVMH